MHLNFERLLVYDWRNGRDCDSPAGAWEMRSWHCSSQTASYWQYAHKGFESLIVYC